MFTGAARGRPLWIALAITLVTACAGAGSARAFSVHGSVEQVYATGLSPHASATLRDRGGDTVAVRRADALGGVLFRGVKPGVGYRVAVADAGSAPAVTVLSGRPAPPSTSIYDQPIPSSGYGYLTTRDGTQLAIDVHPPQDVLSVLPGGLHPPPLPLGPYPTVVEYSGYGYADPAGPQNGIATLANLMGFAVVDVNMRGTGCSGGAYDFFERLQSLDGYDAIETIARQPWVLHHRVGMIGISYGGISQLFVAATDPPSLAAISPLSVIDSTQSTLYPGGILNTGFAVAWAKERIHDALPASAQGGQAWALKRIEQGDATCRANQALHGQAVNLLAKIRANAHYIPAVADPLAPLTFVNRIRVPVYLACQWTDEQTGGHCPNLAEQLTGTQRKWVTFTNGVHGDSLDPATFDRWYDFLQLYVAQHSPLLLSPLIHAASPLIFSVALGINGVTMPPDPIQQQPTFAGALAAFERLAPVRVLFDNGAGAQPGVPLPGFEQSWSAFPIPGTTAPAWYLTGRGALADAPPAHPARDRFTWNPLARPPTDFHGDTASGSGGLWTATPRYDWVQPPPRSAVSYVTAPLRANTTVIGAGAVQLWLRASRPSVDLQATISEVRPDGIETFVQNGWVRADERRLDSRSSTLLAPVLSLRKRDVSPLPRDRFVKLTVPLYYEGHAYRAGSRIRVTIAAPNGDQPIWSFAETIPRGTATVTIESSRRHASRLLLPVVPGVVVPTGLPPCPGLRGEPCRRYQPLVNRGA